MNQLDLRVYMRMARKHFAIRYPKSRGFDSLKFIADTNSKATTDLKTNIRQMRSFDIELKTKNIFGSTEVIRLT